MCFLLIVLCVDNPLLFTVQCCGSETIFFGSGSHFALSFGSGSYVTCKKFPIQNTGFAYIANKIRMLYTVR
jgi:hypothetical protein